MPHDIPTEGHINALAFQSERMDLQLSRIHELLDLLEAYA